MRWLWRVEHDQCGRIRGTAAELCGGLPGLLQAQRFARQVRRRISGILDHCPVGMSAMRKPRVGCSFRRCYPGRGTRCQGDPSLRLKSGSAQDDAPWRNDSAGTQTGPTTKPFERLAAGSRARYSYLPGAVGPVEFKKGIWRWRQVTQGEDEWWRTRW